MRQGDLVSGLKPAAGAKCPAGELLNVKVLSLDHLPMFPEVAIEAMALTKNPDAPLRKIAAVIQRDPSLTTNLLRLANSPFYRTGRAVDTLEQAILRLGIRGCQNLVVTVTLRGMFKSIPASKRQRCELLWRHSFLTAALCRRLNEKLELGFQGQEFLSGLCHDLGRILVAAAAPAYFDLVDPMDFVEAPGFLAHEQKILGTDHCQIGAWFGRLNELPDTLVATIEHHHNPEAAAGHASLVSLIALADQIANFLQRQPQNSEFALETTPIWPSLAPTWGEGKLDLFKQHFPSICAEVLQEADGAMRFTPT